MSNNHKVHRYSILFPIGSFYPSQTGGPSSTIYWLAKGLTEKGHSIKVGTTHKGLQHFHLNFNKWIYLDCGKILYQKTWFHYFPIYLFIKLIPEINKNEIIHLTSLFYPLSWMMAAWIRLFKPTKKIIWSIRGELQEKALSYSSWKKSVLFFTIKKIFRYKIVFHSTSDEETVAIRQKFGQDIKLIQLPNYIYLPEKMNGSVSKMILYLGRLHPIKGLENLLKAFAEIKEKNGFKLIIAGNDRHAY